MLLDAVRVMMYHTGQRCGTAQGKVECSVAMCGAVKCRELVYSTFIVLYIVVYIVEYWRAV